jgi:hypothetical protein
MVFFKLSRARISPGFLGVFERDNNWRKARDTLEIFLEKFTTLQKVKRFDGRNDLDLVWPPVTDRETAASTEDSPNFSVGVF